MSEHTITIILDPKSGLVCPQAHLPELSIGDTVQYVTQPANLPFRVKFVGSSPFTNRMITTRRRYKVRYSGRRSFKCYIQGPDGWVGWTRQHPECGGEHDVRP